MIKKILFISFLLLFSIIVLPFNTAYAQAKDSFYYMQDDGIFSDEEKDEEASAIHDECANDTFKKIYYDCRCIAGAFRAERDKKDLLPQDMIVSNLYDDKNLGCTNTTAIAGDTYEFCAHYAKTFKSREKNNDEYCKCVANKTAMDFKKNPILRLSNIEKIRSNALVSCGSATRRALR